MPPSSHPSLAPFAQGWLLMAGLIVAIGAQNALVLRQGLSRRHVGAVVALCTLSDWLLSAAGVFGLGQLVLAAPALAQGLRLLGIAYLLWLALRAAQRALGPEAGLQAAAAGGSLAATLAGTLAVTWLNPHVYLDTVVLLGAAASGLDATARWGFVAGAGLASAMWFTALGYGAAALAPILSKPTAWRAIDALIALLMLVCAWALWRTA